jgi:hypothetical protein
MNISAELLEFCMLNSSSMRHHFTPSLFNYFTNHHIARIFEIIKTRVMITKLTLTLNQQVIESAKAYAKRNGKSLSSIVESYLRSLEQTEDKKQALSPEVKRLLGSVKLPKNFDYKKELQEAIIKKHLS